MKMNNIFRKTFIGIVAGLTHLVILGTANATPIGIDAFSGSETVTTFNNLGLPFLNTGSLSLDGNTYTTDDNRIRISTFGHTSGMFGNNTGLGFIDVVLGTPALRVGALVGVPSSHTTAIVEFFDPLDNSLGTLSINFLLGLTFLAFEDPALIGRVRFTDRTFDVILAIDDFRFEAASVPEPGALALFGIGLLGLGVMQRRRRRAA